MKKNDETLRILREIKKNPNISQRYLANKVDFSLGKLNYCLNALKDKGLIKIDNFKSNKNRFNPYSKNLSEDYIVHLDASLNYTHELELRGKLSKNIIDQHYFYLEKLLKT